MSRKPIVDERAEIAQETEMFLADQQADWDEIEAWFRYEEGNYHNDFSVVDPLDELIIADEEFDVLMENSF